ncbi:MAG: peptidoglycan DD-metalloendopeptidase family protein [Rhodothermia bacterium]|nr:MAG: peptidoglycan DD-metalloendopeptidase family protein [Rhodothermia bacterium]
MNRTSFALRSSLLGGLLLSVMASSSSFAQDAGDRQTTEARLATLRDEIRSEEARLAAADRSETASRNKVNSLGRQIEIREELVTTYERRLGTMTEERDSLFSSITTLETELERLKNDYRTRAKNAYQYGRLHDVALILSASSINEMLVRIQYLNRFSNTRQSRLENISSTAELLIERQTQLQRFLVRNEVLLSDTQQEQKDLAKLKKKREVEIDRIRSQRVDLTKSITEKRSSADQLNARIRVLIADETSRRELTGTEASKALHSAESNTFSAQKGRLLWPVSGTIEEPFGEVINPDHGTRTNNLQVLIAAEASSEVKAVSSGRVSTIDVMPEYGRFMLIEHGNYVTFYGNLSLLYASPGDTVVPGQIIGRSGTDAEPKGQTIFFGIFDNGKAVDPERWLKSQ